MHKCSANYASCPLLLSAARDNHGTQVPKAVSDLWHAACEKSMKSAVGEEDLDDAEDGVSGQLLGRVEIRRKVRAGQETAWGRRWK